MLVGEGKEVGRRMCEIECARKNANVRQQRPSLSLWGHLALAHEAIAPSVTPPVKFSQVAKVD
jgi:hypothetical protein